MQRGKGGHKKPKEAYIRPHPLSYYILGVHFVKHVTCKEAIGRMKTLEPGTLQHRRYKNMTRALFASKGSHPKNLKKSALENFASLRGRKKQPLEGNSSDW